MNAANLQLEGLLLALYALLDGLKQKGLLTEQEIEEALSTAEANALADPQRVLRVRTDRFVARARLPMRRRHSVFNIRQVAPCSANQTEKFHVDTDS
jgi:hypothetical protein